MKQPTTTEKTDSEANDREETPAENIESMESLVTWRFTEEKKPHSKDKELLIIIIGIGAVLLAIIMKNYIFSALLALATATLVHTIRKKPKHLLFNITPVGMFMDDDFVETGNIKGFNIIDDPGDCARLIIKVEKIVHINEIIPIYDVNIQDIEKAFEKMDIPKDEELGPTIIDRATSLLI